MDETDIRSMQEEILRLRGELSAATHAIAFLFELLSLRNADSLATFRNKIITTPH